MTSASGNWSNKAFTLDDAAFVFQGLWFNTGVKDTNGSNTIPPASWTNDTSSNVTFTFPVAAIGFYVYGFPSLQGGRYGICIDCDPQDPTYLPIDGVKNIVDDQEVPVMLFSKTFAGPGIHEIILRNEADPRFNGSSRLSLSRFDLELVNDGTQSSSSSSPFPLATTTSSSPQSSSTSSMLSGHMGAVIGGAVGGIFVNLILVAAFIFYFRVRRRKRLLASRDSRLGSSQTEYKPSDARRITPFNTYAAVPQSATHLSIPIPTGKSGPYGHRRFASSGSSQDAASDSNVQTPGREQDAGPILLVPREELDVQHTLPPDYEAVFRR
ncbi:hypothetical protein CPC08DRAFT_715339 [Agrocybe pediades]|nr:hypothetical protein CPC08DRAFT_715339 [Agrocybe pediades]